eukprot:scaffold1130_cov195-Pinguiococcus_pyrenoidosus.AAC.77
MRNAGASAARSASGERAVLLGPCASRQTPSAQPRSGPPRPEPRPLRILPVCASSSCQRRILSQPRPELPPLALPHSAGASRRGRLSSLRQAPRCTLNQGASNLPLAAKEAARASTSPRVSQRIHLPAQRPNDAWSPHIDHAGQGLP